jgi:hypothetical protein
MDGLSSMSDGQIADYKAFLGLINFHLEKKGLAGEYFEVLGVQGSCI